MRNLFIKIISTIVCTYFFISFIHVILNLDISRKHKHTSSYDIDKCKKYAESGNMFWEYELAEQYAKKPDILHKYKAIELYNSALQKGYLTNYTTFGKLYYETNKTINGCIKALQIFELSKPYCKDLYGKNDTKLLLTYIHMCTNSIISKINTFSDYVKYSYMSTIKNHNKFKKYRAKLENIVKLRFVYNEKVKGKYPINENVFTTNINSFL